MADDDPDPEPEEERSTESLADADVSIASTPSSYKTRGRLSDPGGTGVFGYNTATTGAGRGVLGRVDAGGGVGVVGVATDASGLTLGVEGVTQSSHNFAAGVRGRAPNGARGVSAFALDEAVYARADGKRDGATGVFGEASASTGETYGVRGITRSGRKDTAGQYPAGVYAESLTNADALRAESNGRAVFVSGGGLVAQEIFSPGTGFNVGLFAAAEGTAGNPIQGEASEDTTPGNTEGVFGRTKTPGDAANDKYPIGVRGRAENASGPTLGVQGDIESRTGAGVIGVSATSGYFFSYSGTKATGVTGVTDKSSETPGVATAAAVEGRSLATTGTAYGVYSAGDARVTGTLDVDETGASVFLSNTQSIDDTFGVVEYDTTRTVDSGEFDPGGSYRYRTAAAGDYHVDAAVEFQNTPNEGTALELQVKSAGGSVLARETTRVGWTNGGSVSLDVSKTITDLGAGAEVSVEARQGDTSNTYDLETGRGRTYLTVTKVG
jgi:hypothetical protein